MDSHPKRYIGFVESTDVYEWSNGPNAVPAGERFRGRQVYGGSLGVESLLHCIPTFLLVGGVMTRAVPGSPLRLS